MSKRPVRALTLSIILLVSTITGGVSVGAAAGSSVTVDGSLQYSDGSTADGWKAALYGSGDFWDYMDANGSFQIDAGMNETHNLTFEQFNHNYDNATNFPRDGIPDIYAVEQVTTGSTNVSLGNRTIPNASVVNVVVQNESGVPISNAEIQVRHHNNGASMSNDAYTNTNGELILYGNNRTGIELTGDVQFDVNGPSGYGFERVTATITNDTNLTVTLPEVATVEGNLTEPDGTPAVNDSVLFEAGSTGELVRTDSNGNFSVQLEPSKLPRPSGRGIQRGLPF